MQLIYRLRIKPKVFLIAGLIAILYSIPAFIYSIGLPGGASLIAMGYFELIGISILAIIIDLVLVNYLNFKILSILELLAILLVYIVIESNYKVAMVNIQNVNKPYIIVI